MEGTEIVYSRWSKSTISMVCLHVRIVCAFTGVRWATDVVRLQRQADVQSLSLPLTRHRLRWRLCWNGVTTIGATATAAAAAWHWFGHDLVPPTETNFAFTVHSPSVLGFCFVCFCRCHHVRVDGLCGLEYEYHFSSDCDSNPNRADECLQPASHQATPSSQLWHRHRQPQSHHRRHQH